MNARLQDMLWTCGSLLVGVAIVSAWYVVSSQGIVSPIFLPGPDKAWAALVEGFGSGSLGQQTLATVERMLYGWVLASLCGIGLGALIGSSRRARAYLAPMIEFIRPLPASAMIPVGIAFFGLTSSMVLGVVAFGSVWPTLLATIHGFGAVEPRLAEVGRILRFSRLEFIFKVALPSAMPDILAAMRLGLTIALVLSVVAEILAFQGGLGSHILEASRSYRSAELFAGVIVLGMIGLVSNVALSLLEHQLLRWRRP
jgi:ABC-type nitrate/sulfonate/bicarbonate transport system permease component